jgi:uncharacterized protein YwgA
MLTQELEKNAAVLSFVLKKINEAHKDKQIGKTIIQKIFYLLKRENIINLNFSLYHYGPFSSEVSEVIDYARENGFISVNWIDEKGFQIKTKNKKHIPLDDDVKEKIQKIITIYSDLQANDLSIIATAFFAMDNYKIEEKNKLIEMVHSIKPMFEETTIRHLIENYVYNRKHFNN